MEHNDLVSFSLPDLVFTWGNLLIMFLIIKKLLFEPVKKVISTREKEVKDTFERAEKAQMNAENLEKEYNQKLTEARLEAVNITKEATKISQEKADVIIEQAKRKAMQILEKAQGEIKIEKDDAIRKALGEVSDIVLITASKLLQRKMNIEDHQEIIEKVLEEVQQNGK